MVTQPEYLNQAPPESDASTVNRLMSAVTSQNNGMDATSLQIRLNTDPTLERVQLYLEGRSKFTEFNEKTGVNETKFIQIAPPKANKLGIHSLMARISTIISIPVVQGNFKEDWYRRYCANVRDSLNDDMLLNQHAWEVKTEDYEHILNMILDLVEAYMTRLLENKEREAMTQSSQTIERVGADGNGNSGGFFSFLKRGN